MPQGESKVEPAAKELLISGDTAAFNAGYDYSEATVGLVLKLSETELSELKKLKKEGKFHLEVCNSFIAPHLKICEGKMRKELRDYVNEVMRRLEILDVHIVVLGSGQARMIPENKTWEDIKDEMYAFLSMCNELGEKYNVTVAIEPLNRDECNVFTTAAESAKTVRHLNLPRIKLLIDAFHMWKENESMSEIDKNIDILVHTHISEPPERIYPGANGGEYLEKFASELKKAGYNERVTMECGYKDFYREMIPAFRFMNKNFR